MHYITGTTFSVKRHSNIWDKEFKLNELYRIQRILSLEKGIKYVFGSRSGTVEIVFESTLQADYFIASHRRENVPDYNAIYQKNTAL
jgi:hypothetical protein